MDKGTEIKIKEYLKDEEKLFIDWYNTLNQPDADTDLIPVALVPVEKIIKIFDKWFETNKNAIKLQICDEWIHLFKGDVVNAILIAQLADLLAMVSFSISVNFIATASILAINGYMENICSS